MATIKNKSNDLPPLPMLRPTWTTWAYMGLAIIVAALAVYGFWYAGSPHLFR